MQKANIYLWTTFLEAHLFLVLRFPSLDTATGKQNDIISRVTEIGSFFIGFFFIIILIYLYNHRIICEFEQYQYGKKICSVLF